MTICSALSMRRKVCSRVRHSPFAFTFRRNRRLTFSQAYIISMEQWVRMDKYNKRLLICFFEVLRRSRSTLRQYTQNNSDGNFCRCITSRAFIYNYIIAEVCVYFEVLLLRIFRPLWKHTLFLLGAVICYISKMSKMRLRHRNSHQFLSVSHFTCAIQRPFRQAPNKCRTTMSHRTVNSVQNWGADSFVIKLIQLGLATFSSKNIACNLLDSVYDLTASWSCFYASHNAL